MIRFLDGPAVGAALSLARIPMFLRVVIDPLGNVDALDQLDDAIRDGETAYVYRLATDYGTGFVCRRGHGCSRIAAYRFYATQPDQDVLRDNQAWQAWAMAAAAAEENAGDASGLRGPGMSGLRKSNVHALNDDSRMPFGTHKAKRLGDVPDHWWRWFLVQDWCDDYPDLVEYANTVMEDE